MTVTAPLKSLTLTAFRGSSATFTLPFEKNRKLTLLYGENGTGKTTICDAFEFLARGNIGSLDERGMGSGLSKYWPTAGKSASTVAVILESYAAKCSAMIDGTKVSVSPESARPRVEILRHRRILKLMEAQPKDRYNEIARFIDIGTFEQSEEALRQLGKSLAGEKQQALTAEQENLAILQGYYENAGNPPGLNAVTWARQKLAVPTTSHDDDITAISKLRNAYEAIKPFPAKLATHQATVAITQADATLADQNQLAALAAVGDNAADTLNLLLAGHAYLDVHPDAEACPLCASAENIHGLCAVVKNRLAQMEILKAAMEEWRKHHAALDKAKAALKQTEGDYQKAIAVFAAAKESYAGKSGILLPSTVAPATPVDLNSWLAENAPKADAWATTEAEWRDESRSLAQLKTVVERYESNAARVQELQARIPKVEEALRQCEAERKKFTDGIMGDIAQRVGILYESVHPGEGLDAIALELDPKKRASLELKAKFSGQDAPPQAYFSQSHLDTLGLCVFLALALRDRPEETILVLDDVLSSVDEPHVQRVIGMIYEVSTKFRHTLVTTHYRPWREKYRWGLLKPDQVCQFVELTSWFLGQGIALSGSIPEIVRFKALLADPTPDIQSICGKAGVILEALLDFLTLKYGCAVPRRLGGTYTLGDLLPAINGKLLVALKVEMLTHAENNTPTITAIELKPILEEIAKIANARNVMGAHFNTLSFDLLDADGINFAKQVEKLSDALICPDHGWPNKDKSGSYWNNGGDTRRLHPLKKPA
jgi:recombinational DNA repair ATPase RecF